MPDLAEVVRLVEDVLDRCNNNTERHDVLTNLVDTFSGMLSALEPEARDDDDGSIDGDDRESLDL